MEISKRLSQPSVYHFSDPQEVSTRVETLFIPPQDTQEDSIYACELIFKGDRELSSGELGRVSTCFWKALINKQADSEATYPYIQKLQQMGLVSIRFLGDSTHALSPTTSFFHLYQKRGVQLVLHQMQPVAVFEAILAAQEEERRAKEKTESLLQEYGVDSVFQAYSLEDAEARYGVGTYQTLTEKEQGEVLKAMQRVRTVHPDLPSFAVCQISWTGLEEEQALFKEKGVLRIRFDNKF